MSWGKFKMAPAKRVKRCDMSTSEFTTIDTFFVNVNKSSFAEIVHKQSESASFVKLVEIHNVETLKFSLIRAPVHLHNLRVGSTRHYYRQQFPGSSTQAAGKPRTIKLYSA